MAGSGVRNSGFCSMKPQGEFTSPPGWDASPLQGYPWASILLERQTGITFLISNRQNFQSYDQMSDQISDIQTHHHASIKS